MNTRRRLWAVTAAGAAAILGALWEAVGPFSVTATGQSLSCGSPFLGRYMSPGDPMATLSYLCHQQAPTRRVVTFVLAGVALVLSLTALLLIVRAKGTGGDMAAFRGMIAAEATGATAALLIIATGAFAVLRVAG